MRLIIAAVILGFAAFWMARAVGLPIWQNWVAGDATDVGFGVAVAVMLLGSR